MKIGIIARFKQGDLLEAMVKRGWTQKQLGEFLGFGPSQIGELINMKWVPAHFSEELEAKLIELTGKTSEQLFPAVIRTDEFRQANKALIAFREADPVELLGSGIRCLPLPENRGGKEDLVGAIIDATNVLSSREKEVLKRVINGENDVEIAEEMSLSPQRIGQIRSNAQKRVYFRTRQLLAARFGSADGFGC